MKIFTPLSIKDLRRRHGLTLEAFASRLGPTCKRQHVHKWESGLSVPSVRSLLQIVNAFGVSFDIFFTEIFTSVVINSYCNDKRVHGSIVEKKARGRKPGIRRQKHQTGAKG
ncbi:MAG: helix-turn-helix transcriptional regulator [Nitrospirales bacterium]|nr:helix-turn-helix transcriptional regulator [Nitrospirales bacterium]